MKLFLLLSTLFILSSCATKNIPSYPNHWWQTVDKSTAPKWEILPQEAVAGEVVLSKRNELGILSNFSKTPFTFEGVRYNSIEGFWQMMKYPEHQNDERYKNNVSWPISREKLSQLSSFEAKRYGSVGSKNMKNLNINWVTYRGNKVTYKESIKGKHYQLILSAMKQKLKQNPKVRSILLSTGNLKLIPDHYQDNPPPAWKYHKIWMELRQDLK